MREEGERRGEDRIGEERRGRGEERRGRGEGNVSFMGMKVLVWSTLWTPCKFIYACMHIHTTVMNLHDSACKCGS